MTSNIGDDIRRTFALAAMQKEAKHIQASHQWNRANEIMQRCGRLRETENRLFRDHYDIRVEAARHRLIDDAGRRGRPFRPEGAGADRFNPIAILTQADRDVRAAHHRRLMRIGDLELEKLAALVKQSERENARKHEAQSDFQRAADRRSAQDRRETPGPEKPPGRTRD